MAEEPLTADFVDEVKAGLSRRDPVQQRLSIASHGVDLSRDYFVAAIKAAAPHAREVLANLMAHGPDEDDPGAPTGLRTRAAYWFLCASYAGFWTATPEEIETARTLITIGGFAMPEKTKADLAREAGLPTVDMVMVRPFPKPVTKPVVKPVGKTVAKTRPTRRQAKITAMLGDRPDDPIALYVAITQAGARMKAVLDDPAATDAAKVDAVNRCWDILHRLAPAEFEAAFWDALKIILADYKTSPTTTTKGVA